jgi:asparaginyl-tRNA synthetase
VRSQLALATHRFFGDRGFVHVHTPAITTCDAEGAGEVFALRGPGDSADDEGRFFGRQAYLTVSGQLHAEALASALSSVYTFGPAFRAEDSHTARHLAELWMVEPEIAWADLGGAADLAEGYIKATVAEALAACVDDLQLLAARAEPLAAGLPQAGPEPWCLLRELEAVADPGRAWPRLSYTDAVAELSREGERRPFAGGAPEWGAGLSTEHERWLAAAVGAGQPLVVTDYPAVAKPFYFRQNPDGRTVASMDILFPRLARPPPQIPYRLPREPRPCRPRPMFNSRARRPWTPFAQAELVGGGQREERLEQLAGAMAAKGTANPEDYEWYLDLRRWGSAPHAGAHAALERGAVVCRVASQAGNRTLGFRRYGGGGASAGFGLGFDRLVQFVCGLGPQPVASTTTTPKNTRNPSSTTYVVVFACLRACLPVCLDLIARLSKATSAKPRRSRGHPGRRFASRLASHADKVF